MKTFETEFDPKNNSMGFVRLFLAMLVLISHSYALTGYNIEPLQYFSHGQSTFGTIAVSGFFGLSGFLITRSLINSKDFFSFFWHRFLRIFPGFWVNLIVTAFLFVPLVYIFQNRSFNDFFNFKNSPITYIYKNSFLLMNQFTINEIRITNNQIAGFNGSLWTLIHEFICYILIGIIGIVGRILKKQLIVAFFFFSIISYLIIFSGLHFNMKLLDYFFKSNHIIFFKLFSTFLMGGIIFTYSHKIHTNYFIAFTLIIICIVCLLTKYAIICEIILIPYLTLFISMNKRFRNFDKKGDLSYGLYIYAWPIQIIICIFEIYKYSFIAYNLIVIFIVLMFAYLSYHLVEKQFLKFKNFI